jgi:peptidoglycan/xylan/chitin deacetylase (PgdA/CDA1 family)
MRYYTHGRRDQAKVALTFDDGPNPPRTDEVLEILASAGARGTFFVIGRWVDRFPQAFERIVRAGHCIGNHSYEHHLHLGDYDRAEAAIANFTGRRTIFARPHVFDFASFSLSVFAQLETTRVIDADVNPADYAATHPQEIVDRVLDHPSLGNGSVIDLHDGTEHEDPAIRLSRPIPMVEALPAIVEGLTERGFDLVGLDDMELADPLEWDATKDRMLFNPTGRGLVVR